MRYEQGLATLFERRFFYMDHVSLAHIAGFGHRLPDWLSSRHQRHERSGCACSKLW